MQRVKVISSKESPEVWLRIGNLKWSSLPLPVKTDLLAGLERVAQIRTDILRSAKVQALPPIEVVGQIWATDQSTIDGLAGYLSYQLSNRMVLGAQFPSLTAMCVDNAVVRKAIVHEFLHCFNYVVVSMDPHSRGHKIDLDDPFDPKADAESLENPPDWFSGEDAAPAALHDDPIFAPIQDRFNELKPFFPVLVPDVRDRVVSVAVDPDIAAYAEELIRRRREKTSA